MMMTNHTRCALLFALPLFFVSCSGPGTSGPAAQSGPGRGGRGAGGPVPVLTTKVERRAVPLTIPAVGTVESVSSVQIRSQVTGQLSTISFREGQEVRKGDPLFTLDQRPFRAALLQAEAVLARDAATYKNAQLQESRLQNLSERGLISKDQYDTQHANTLALGATIDADKAAIETARVNLLYTEIKSPIDGRTGALNAHVGDLVRSSDTTPLVVINQLAPIYVTFSVPGRFLPDIRRFQAQRPLAVNALAPTDAPDASPAAAASPALAAAPGAALSPAPDPASIGARGALAFIDNTVDSTTGTIRLKASFPNADRQLWPGAFVQVTLSLTTDNDAIVVPAVAVQTSQDGQYVYLVKSDKTVEMRPVKTDRQQGDQMVIASGVAAGDIVVTDGHLRLAPGARVSERGDAAPRAGAGGRSGQPETAGAGQGRGRQGAL
jgi:membrane fusion protein, multidrug efflux system